MNKDIQGVTVKLGGEDRILALDLNALITYSTITGKELQAGLSQMVKGSNVERLSAIRQIVYAALVSFMEWEPSNLDRDLRTVGNWLQGGALMIACDAIMQAQSAMEGEIQAKSEFPGQLAPFVPTPPAVVEAMIQLAEIRDHDYILDLGAGDGRLLIAAAEAGKNLLGIRIVGYELSETRMRNIRRLLAERGLENVAHCKFKDIMEAADDAAQASIVFMYLLQSTTNQVYRSLPFEAGTRIICHDFTIEDLKAENTVHVQDDGGNLHTVTSYIVPAKKG